MDALTAALIGGLLGGGVAGALVGGLVTLHQQRRDFDHERRTRFLDLKRQRYADLLRMTDEWVRALTHQRDVAAGVRDGRGSAENIPTLGPTTAIEQVAAEIDLLTPRDVGRAANRLLMAVIGLGAYRYDADGDGRLRMEHLVSFHEALASFTGERNQFLEAAKADLETAA